MPLTDNELFAENEKKGFTRDAGRDPIFAPSNLPTFTPNIGELSNVGQSPLDSKTKELLNLATMLTTPLSKDKVGISSYYNYNPTDIDTSGRYDRILLGQDNEEIAAQMQSSWDKAANGLLKGAGIAGTTFLDGTVGLLAGTAAAIGAPSGKKLNAFYDNPFTNYMMELNKSMENYMPNYYTQRERDAKWYEPDNLFTANFFWDKIIKNLGFSIGAMYSGYLVGGAVSLVPEIFGISKAGKLAQLAAKLEQGLQGIPELERAAKAKDIIMQEAKLVKTIDRLSAAENLVTAGLAASTESGIEALQGTNDFRDKLITEYKDKYGEEPEGADLANINQRANDLGNARFGLNMAVLSVSNYLTFPKILGTSYKAGKENVVNAVRNNFETGILESSLPTKGFAKRLYQFKNIAGLFVSPKEAAEEGAQYAIEKGVEEYYKPGVNSYYNKGRFTKGTDAGDYLDALWDAAGKGVKALSDKEGIESMLIGALSGGIQQAGIAGTYQDEKGKTRFGLFKSGEIAARGFTGYGGALAKNTGDLISKGAPFSLKGDNWLKDNVEAAKRGVNLQQDYAESVRRGDVLESKDAEFEMQHNYLFPRVKYGRFDLVKQDIENYRKLAGTADGLRQLKEKGIANEGDTTEMFLNRLKNFENNAVKLKSIYEGLRLRVGGLVDKNTNQLLFNDEAIEKMAFASAKVSDYSNRMKMLATELLGSNIPVVETDAYITKAYKDRKMPEDGSKVFEGISTSINNIQGATDAEKEELRLKVKDYTELALRREEFLDEYNKLQKNPFYSQIKTSDTGETELDLMTKKGAKKVKVGASYYLLHSPDVKNPNVGGISRFVIAGTTKEGKVILLDSATNEMIVVDKDGLKESYVYSAEDLKNNPNARLFLSHGGSAFTYTPKPGATPIATKLEYDPERDVMRLASQEGKAVYSVTRDQFLDKPGQEAPQVQLQNEEYSDEAAEALAVPVTEAEVKSKYAQKDFVINDTMSVVTEQLSSVKKAVSDILGRIEEINKKIKAAQTTKQGTPKKNISKEAQEAITVLSKEIATLTAEKEKWEELAMPLERMMNYLEDLRSYKDALPDNFSDVIDELETDIKRVKEVEVQHKEVGNQLDQALSTAKTALKQAVDFLRSFITNLKDANPDVIFVTDTLEQSLESGNISGIDFREDVNNLRQQILDEAERLKIPEMASQVAKLQESLSKAAQALRDSKDAVINAETAFKVYKLLKASLEKRLTEEAELLRSNALKAELGNIMEQAGQRIDFARVLFEADSRKADSVISRSTIVPSDEHAAPGEVLREHHKRSNYFGANFYKMGNRDSIKGFFVTAQNEDKIFGGALKGIIDHYLEGAVGQNRNDLILLVVAQEANGKIQLVDKDGLVLENPTYDNAIYQGFPSEKLVWKNGETMFRKETTAAKQQEIREAYKKWRDKVLANPPAKGFKIQPSGGHPILGFEVDELERKIKDAEGRDIVKYVGVEAASLVDAATFNSQNLIFIPTTEGSITKGNVTFTAPVGKVFLSLEHGFIPLKGRTLNSKEADTIYKALHRLSAIMLKNHKLSGNVEAMRLINWLRTIVYFGTPANTPGNNSIWFDTTKGLLNFGKSGFSVGFTPSAIEGLESQIKAQLQTLYNNVNNNKASDWNSTYEEITDIAEDGTVTSRNWKNYQTYLLSSENRTPEEIPLKTNLKEVTPDTLETNRVGIYLTVDGLDSIPEVVITTQGGNKLIEDGVSKNVFVSKDGIEVTFTLKPGQNPDINFEDLAVKIQTSGLLAKRGIAITDVEAGEAVLDEILEETEQYVAQQRKAAPAPPVASTITDAQQAIRKVFPYYDKILSDLESWLNSGKSRESYDKAYPSDSAIINDPITYLKTLQQRQEQSIVDTQKKIAELEAEFQRTNDKAVGDSIAANKTILERDRNKLEDVKKAIANVQDILGTLKKGTVTTGKSAETKKAELKEFALNTGEYLEDLIHIEDVFKNSFEDKAYPSPFSQGYEDFLLENKNKTTEQEVSVDNIIPTQVYLEKDRVNKLEDKDAKLPILVKEGNKYYVLNGHHRIAVGINNGASTIRAIVVDAELAPSAPIKVKTGIDADIQAVSNAKTKEELIAAAEKLVGINPYDDGAVSMATRAALMTPGSFDRGKTLFLEEIKGLIEQRKKAEKTQTTADKARLENELDNIDDTEFEDAPFREQVTFGDEYFETEDWKSVEKWLKANFPGLPVYRVKNAIRSTDGSRTAWGMLKNGAIYVMQEAEVGTIYHEVFEAVWKMLTTAEEQAKVLQEFRSRTGTFVDRVTGKQYEYSSPEVTNNQVKEQLAEEFRDHVLAIQRKEKVRAGKSFIRRLFDDLVEFFNNFFTGRNAVSNTEALFKKISDGNYRSYFPQEASLSFAKKGYIDIEDVQADRESEFRIKGLSQHTVNSILQQMTYTVLSNLASKDESLLLYEKIPKAALYETLKLSVEKAIKSVYAQKAKAGTYSKEGLEEEKKKTLDLLVIVNDNWAAIQALHEQVLQTYDVEFDEEDYANVNPEDKTKGSDYQEATKIDMYRKMPSAIKLLLSTLARTKLNSEGEVKIVPSSIGGIQLIPTSEVYMTLKNRLHSAIGIDDMLEKLRLLAEENSDYVPLYRRLTRNADYKLGKDESIKWENLRQDNTQVLAMFFGVMKQQLPEVYNLYIYGTGDVQVGSAHTSSASRELKSQMEETLTQRIKTGATKLFKFDQKTRSFSGDREVVEKFELNSLERQIAFLNELGIFFQQEQIKKLPGKQQQKFASAVNGLRTSILKVNQIVTITGRYFKINKRLGELADIQALILNPEFSATYYGGAGEKKQAFIGTNAVSDLYDQLSAVKNLYDLEGTPYAYLIPGKDSNSKNSYLLSKIFNMTWVEKLGRYSGEKIEGADDFMQFTMADSTIDENSGKTVESAKQNYRTRLIQQINMLLAGYQYVLVPADASIESMAYMGEAVNQDEMLSPDAKIKDIFKGYFISEVDLSKETNRNIKEVGKRKKTDLRFFKGILGAEMHSEVVEFINSPENVDKTAEEVYAAFETKVDNAVKSYLKKAAQRELNTLMEYDIITKKLEVTKNSQGVVTARENEEVWSAPSLSFAEKDADNLTADLIDAYMYRIAANYAINNIELHKVLYADPYQYTDELKRIKNSLSPSRPIISRSPNMNKALHKVWNKGYKKGDIGYTNLSRDYFRTVVGQDIKASTEDFDYEDWKETDGGGLMTLQAHRNLRIRAGQWNDSNEDQYRYDIAYEKVVKGEGLTDKQKKEKGLQLSEDEQELYEKGNPSVASTYTPVKPKAFGNKENGNSYNDIVLDKFALYPVSFRVFHEFNKTMSKKSSNIIDLYNKMQAEDVDYIVFESSRKVGVERLFNYYNENGGINSESFTDYISNIPYSTFSIQSEVPSKEDNEAPRGTQVTKIVTMDLLEAGVPADFEPTKDFADRYEEWFNLPLSEREKKSDIYKEVQRNEELLEKITEHGYKTLLRKLSIKEVNGTYEIASLEKAAKVLKDQILSREVNDNILDALRAFQKGKVTIESTVAYQQVRNILYSLVDKNVISPTIKGGQKVQIPSSFLEEKRIQATDKEGVFKSEELAFYKNAEGKMVCEIYVSRWFDSPLSDEELLKIVNEQIKEKGFSSFMSGLGYRIPTQKQNSIESYVIKGFLPKEMKDSVVVPSAIVAKSGSDFDIDKLTMYLKNVYVDEKGVPHAIKLDLIDTSSIQQLKGFYERHLLERYKAFKEAAKELEAERSAEEFLSAIYGDLDEMQDVEDDFSDYEGEEIQETLEEKYKRLYVPSLERFIAKNRNTDKYELYRKWGTHKYSSALQNAYIESLQALVSRKENFEALTSANSADLMKGLAKEILTLKGIKDVDYTDVNNMLSLTFMSRLRHSFVTGKYAIGIAAVNQTNQSLMQRLPMYIDTDKIGNQNAKESLYLGDGKINLDHNQMDVVVDGVKKTVATFSKIKDALNQQRISDIISQFIDGYVDIAKGPWIMSLGATPNVASTYLVLVKLGVPIRQVVFFMNQPIIKDFLRELENSGYSWLFNDRTILSVVNSKKYAVDTIQGSITSWVSSMESANEKQALMPAMEELEANVGKTSFSDSEKRQQQFALREFLKYAQLANQLFTVIQGSNFDTANLNDPFLVFKKEELLNRARNSVISSVDKMMGNSLLSPIYKSILKVNDAFGQILVTNRPRVKNVVETILKDYVQTPDREFVKIARKVVNDLFDWAAQTAGNNNQDINEVLIGDKSVMNKIAAFLDEVAKNPQHKMRYNELVKPGGLLQILPSRRADGGVNNLKLSNKSNKVYDQNSIITSFAELKDYLNDSSLYKGLVRLAVFQSGLTNSPISFTDLIPFDDFQEQYGEALAALETLNLQEFLDTDSFYRNNWSNTDIVPYVKARWYQDFQTGEWEYDPARKKLPFHIRQAVEKKQLPEIVSISSYSYDSQNDYLTYSWEDIYKYNKEERYKMRQAGDFSFMNMVLLKKIYDPKTNEPYTYKSGKNVYYLYKQINAWGDSFRAKEFYNYARKTALINNYKQLDKEMTDEEIIRGIAEAASVKPETSKEAPPVIKKELPAPEMTDARVKSLYDKVVEQLSLEDINNAAKAVGLQFSELSKAQSWASIFYEPVLDPEFAQKDSKATLDLLITPVGQKTLSLLYLGETINKSTEEAKNLLDLSNKIIERTLEMIQIASQPSTTDVLFDPALPKVNIYAGTGENAELSNFAVRPFKIDEYAFNTVEGYFQARKMDFSTEPFDKDLLTKFQSASGAQAKSMGRAVKGLKVDEWNSRASEIMKEGLLESFKQNPDALAKLLATGNAELTHTQDKGKWGKEFPKLLMEVRNELRTGTTTEKGPTLSVEPGRYVKYKEGTYIVTKENANGTIQIYNPTMEGASAKISVSRANLTPMQDVAKMVTYKDAEYMVTPKGSIISLATNKIMKWGDENGDRKAILDLAGVKPAPKKTTFEGAFSQERRASIVKNFALKHKMTEEKALQYVEAAIEDEGQKIIDLLDKCY